MRNVQRTRNKGNQEGRSNSYFFFNWLLKQKLETYPQSFIGWSKRSIKNISIECVIFPAE